MKKMYIVELKGPSNKATIRVQAESESEAARIAEEKQGKFGFVVISVKLA